MAGRVVIVHGRDNERKREFAVAIRALTGTEPLILHEHPDHGEDVLREPSDRAAFVIVLLTADEQGRPTSYSLEQPRARQDVLVELGVFVGALGRARVAVFRDPLVEEPPGLHGIASLPIDDTGVWRSDLARLLTAAGPGHAWTARPADGDSFVPTPSSSGTRTARARRSRGPQRSTGTGPATPSA